MNDIPRRQSGDKQQLENILRASEKLRRQLLSYHWRVFRAGRLHFQVGSEAYGWLYDGRRNRRIRFWTRRGAQKAADQLNRKAVGWLLNSGIASGPGQGP